jgi:hypothetical protein
MKLQPEKRKKKREKDPVQAMATAGRKSMVTRVKPSKKVYSRKARHQQAPYGDFFYPFPSQAYPISL